MIAAVLFDLDDTLYPQEAFLAGAWRAVAAAAASGGVPERAFHDALVDVARQGSAKGGIIDRALARIGFEQVAVGPLVDAFRGYHPARLDPYPGAVEALERLRQHVRIGLVTDGDPRIQAAKLTGLGIAPLFDIIVCSDTLGRERRKPHPAPFLAALDAIGVPPAAAAYIGDRPDKDVAGALGAGLLPVRVRTGEYAHLPDDPPAAVTVADVVEAVAFLESRCRTSAPAS